MITNNYKKIIFTLLVPAAFFGMSNSGNVFTYKNSSERIFVQGTAEENDIAVNIFDSINDVLSKITTKPAKEIVAKKQDLTFEVFKNILKKESYDGSAIFKYLKTSDGRYNAFGYLLSDNFLYDFIFEEKISSQELAEKIMNSNGNELSKKQDLTFKILLNFLKDSKDFSDSEVERVRKEIKEREGKYTWEMLIGSDQFLIEVLGRENLKESYLL